MTLASMVRARPLQVAVVGMAMIALGGLPAFADTPFHGARDPHAAPWHQEAVPQDRYAGCDARMFPQDRWGYRDNACATPFAHRDNRFDQHQDNGR